MTFCRAAAIALALAALPLSPAAAQFGGMPGMPGSPGPGGGFGASPFEARPQQQPPAACQQLITLRDETSKSAQALQAAGQKKAPPDEMCKHFKTYLAAENKMVKGLEQNSSTCGVPAEVIKQVKGNHAKASEIGKKVCDAAAMGPRPAGPSLSEALGTTPVVPDASNTSKRGQGTFDTLTGSPLTR
ncbi:MAG: hypothetical protein IT537_09585 [Hyphomicrobiales bacterium]|nr:hypothetical protein [Hyphomicrobiales bacterium]